MSSEENQSIRERVLEVLKHNNTDFEKIIREKINNNETFDYSLNNKIYTFKCSHAGKYHYLSIKHHEEFLLVYSVCEDYTFAHLKCP